MILTIFSSFGLNGISKLGYRHFLLLKSMISTISCTDLFKALRIYAYKLSDRGTVRHCIGFHHDLRPVNILRLKQRLVIADFGLPALKSAS